MSSTTVGKMFPNDSDGSPNRCTHIDLYDNPQSIKRCNNNKRKGSKEFCILHAYSVTHIQDDGDEVTELFDSIEEAEKFRKTVNWSELNYVMTGLTDI